MNGQPGAEVFAGVLRSQLEPLLRSQHEQIIARLARLEQTIAGESDGPDLCGPSAPEGSPPSLYASSCDNGDCEDDENEDTEDNCGSCGSEEKPRKSTVEDKANLVFSSKLSVVSAEKYQEKADSVAASMSTLTYSASSLTLGEARNNPFRVFPRNLIMSKWFDWVAVSLILSNAVFLGIQADHFAGVTMAESPPVVQAVSWFYCIMFFIELILRILSDGLAFFYNKMWLWNLFDFFTVASSALEVVLQFFDIGQGSRNLSLLRLLRVARVIRILRVIRISRFFRELRVLVLAISSALRSLFWAMLLLLTIMYVTGIALTQSVLSQVNDSNTEASAKLRERYGSISRSIYTLWLTISGGISWVEVADPLTDVDPIYLALLLAFIAFVQIAVLNVVTGVFCENAIKSAANDEAEVLQEQIRHKALYVERLTKLFHDCESGSSGQITLRDFQMKLSDPIAIAYFKMMDLEVSNALSLFRLLDGDDSGSIELNEFVEGCLALRGTAKRLDAAKIMKKSSLTLEHVLSVKRDTKELIELITQVKEMRSVVKPSQRFLTTTKFTSKSVMFADASQGPASFKVTAERGKTNGELPRTFSL